MTAHTIVAINTIADLGPIAGISSSIVIVGIVSIDVVIIDIASAVSVISSVSVVSVISSIIDINSPQKIASRTLQQLPQSLRR